MECPTIDLPLPITEKFLPSTENDAAQRVCQEGIPFWVNVFPEYDNRAPDNLAIIVAGTDNFMTKTPTDAY